MAHDPVEIMEYSFGESTYISTRQLVSDTLEWVKSFPKRFDMVVGIPRAGMIPASLIATHLGVPLTMPDLFPRAFAGTKTFDSIPNEVLLVDDSSGHGEGGTTDTILKKLQLVSPLTKFWKASTYVKESCANYFDLFHKIVHDGRFIQEWQLQQVRYFSLIMSDMDGVLCEDCPKEIDADESKYLNHIANARPYLIPKYEIEYILTGRLEKYRPFTEAWLAKHRVRYRKLIMWNLEDKSLRRNPAEYKARELMRIKPEVYYESRHSEAEKINQMTGIHVFCFEHRNFVGSC